MKTINHKLLLYYVFKKVFFLHCIFRIFDYHHASDNWCWRIPMFKETKEKLGTQESGC